MLVRLFLNHGSTPRHFTQMRNKTTRSHNERTRTATAPESLSAHLPMAAYEIAQHFCGAILDALHQSAAGPRLSDLGGSSYASCGGASGLWSASVRRSTTKRCGPTFVGMAV